MDFVGGNLDEFLHPEKHAAELAACHAGASAPPMPAPAPQQPGVPPQAGGGCGDGSVFSTGGRLLYAALMVRGTVSALPYTPAQLRQLLPVPPPQVRYNPAMKFGPEPGQVPTFRLTIASPRLSVSGPAACAEAAPRLASRGCLHVLTAARRSGAAAE